MMSWIYKIVLAVSYIQTIVTFLVKFLTVRFTDDGMPRSRTELSN